MTRYRFFGSIIACMALCAVAVVHAVERAIDWGLGLLPVTSPAITYPGDFAPAPAFATFADPHVSRHEAGMATRAAARGI